MKEIDPLGQNVPYLFYRKIFFLFGDPKSQRSILNFSIPVGFRAKINFLTVKRPSLLYELKLDISRSSSNHEYFDNLTESKLFCRKNNEMLLSWHDLHLPIEYRENFSIRYFCIPIGIFREESFEVIVHATLEREKELQVA